MATGRSSPATLLQPPQLSISPSKCQIVLDGASSQNVSSTAHLTLINLSQAPGGVAFKVQTTKPKRYVVRPNQGLIGPGERLVVEIWIPPHQKTGAVEEYNNSGGNHMKDKFKVVYMQVQDAEYMEVADVKPMEVTEHLHHLWKQANRKGIFSHKFDVEWKLFEGVSAHSRENQSSSPKVDANTAKASSPSAAETEEEAFFYLRDEILDYRQRYDELVSDTIVLTLERDELVRSLDVTTFELRWELSSQCLRGQSSHEAMECPSSSHESRSSSSLKASFVRSIIRVLGIASGGDPSSVSQVFQCSSPNTNTAFGRERLFEPILATFRTPLVFRDVLVIALLSFLLGLFTRS